MSNAPVPRHTNGALGRVIEHGDVLTMERTWRKAGRAVQTEAVEERMESIHAALLAGDIDNAYDTFSDWIRQESRYANADHKTNMCELVKTMLEMMSWMHERVPRSMVKATASVD